MCYFRSFTRTVHLHHNSADNEGFVQTSEFIIFCETQSSSVAHLRAKSFILSVFVLKKIRHNLKCYLVIKQNKYIKIPLLQLA